MLPVIYCVLLGFLNLKSPCLYGDIREVLCGCGVLEGLKRSALVDPFGGKYLDK